MPHPSFAHTAHRPWPLPKAAWEWRQSWRDLLFAHWQVPVAAVRPLVPAALDIDTYDGQTYVGIVPFRMAGVMRRPLPDLPYFSAFPEINVRVYVVAEDKPGVWFLSLDATNRMAVAAARTLFHLPYYRANMDVIPDGDGLTYRSFRQDKTHGQRLSASLVGNYRPASPVYTAEPGSLERWLTERYCLYAQHPNGTIYRTEVHHKQWPLQQATAELVVNTISAAGGLPVSGPPQVLHFSRRIDVVVYGPERVGTS